MTHLQLYCETGVSSSVGSVIDHLIREIERDGHTVYRRNLLGQRQGPLKGGGIGWFHGYPHQLEASGIHAHRHGIAGLQTDSRPADPAWRHPLRRLRHVYVPSTWVAQTLRPVLHPACDVFVVHHGVEPPQPPEPGEKHAREFTALTISGAGPWPYQQRKGVDLAVEATRLAGIRLILRAGGDEARKWLDQQDAPHVVHIPGYLTPQQLSALYRSADVVLVPSRSEAFGMVAMEALAHGVPVVAAGGTGMDDYLPRDMRAVVAAHQADRIPSPTFGNLVGNINDVETKEIVKALLRIQGAHARRRRYAEMDAPTWTADHSWTHAARPLLDWIRARV